ncbi:MAG: 2-oxoglutarate dehydrogenase complex dihydrolipoyllysine-residue succinyltransferase [Cytophagales bacterium]|nr:MAG: 2-oxoglutarate dehydrogenase complex dihydrolipoyllysine-residue succinyltransferase [Cytophagales bacterium]
MIEMKVPAVGESVTEVTIATWFKKDGEFVNAEEILCELESDKATFELPAEASGILRHNAKVGDTLPIGVVICKIETEKTETKTTTTNTPPPAAEIKNEIKMETKNEVKSEILSMTVPSVGESITEVTLSNWLKKDGDFVKLDEILCELESDKATFELPAKAEGILRHIAKAGDVLAVGSPICNIEAGANASSTPATVTPPPAKEETKQEVVESKDSYASGTPSPAASKILAEKGINPQEVKGSGKDGRITKEDAVNANPKPEEKAVAPAKKEDAPAVMPSMPFGRNSRKEKMTSLRKTVARRLVAVKNETAMLTTFNEVNMQAIMDLRAKYKDAFKEKHQVGLGFMSFFVKAVCLALQEFPAVNAQIIGDEIIYNDFADISIAVSAPKGLVVPVVRNAESLSLADIEKEILRLAGKARENKLSIPEMTGGTFTITNGGVFGSLMSTPIINAPQSAILGMHNIVERPIALNGQVVIKPMMYVALSYDHRIIDGRESVGFLVRVKQLLEDPARILLGM